jgi:hypothetical protein
MLKVLDCAIVQLEQQVATGRGVNALYAQLLLLAAVIVQEFQDSAWTPWALMFGHAANCCSAVHQL